MNRRDKRTMELLNLTYEELQDAKMKARLEAVKNHYVVFIETVHRRDNA